MASKEKRTATGLHSTDLQLLRMMMAQQRYPTVTIPAIQDVGSGINAAAAQIFNALMARKEMSQQQQQMQMLLAQEQANQEREAAAVTEARNSGAQALMQTYGIPYELAYQIAGQPDAVQNSYATGFQQKLDDQRAREAEAPVIKGIMAHIQSLGGVDRKGNPNIPADENLYNTAMMYKDGGDFGKQQAQDFILKARFNEINSILAEHRKTKTPLSDAELLYFKGQGFDFKGLEGQKLDNQLKNIEVQAKPILNKLNIQKLGEDIKGQQLSNENQDIKNNSDRIDLGVKADQDRIRQNLRDGKISPQQAVQMSLSASPDIVGDVGKLGAKETKAFTGLKKLENYTVPVPEAAAPVPAGGGGGGLEFSPAAIAQGAQNYFTTPQGGQSGFTQDTLSLLDMPGKFFGGLGDAWRQQAEAQKRATASLSTLQGTPSGGYTQQPQTNYYTNMPPMELLPRDNSGYDPYGAARASVSSIQSPVQLVPPSFLSGNPYTYNGVDRDALKLLMTQQLGR